MISYITGAVGACVALSIVILIRKDKLNSSIGFGWLMVATAFALLGFTPSLFDHVANTVGIKYPPTLAFTLAIGAIVIKLLLTDIQHTKLLLRQQRITQRLALLETETRRLRAQMRETDASLKQPNSDQQ